MSCPLSEKVGVPHGGTLCLLIGIDPEHGEKEKGGFPHDGTPYLLIVVDPKR